MFFCLCAGTTLDLYQAKAQLLIKNVKLFAHTEKNLLPLHSEIRNKCRLTANLLDFHRARCFARCNVKRKKEGKLPETFLNDIKNKNCLG